MNSFFCKGWFQFQHGKQMNIIIFFLQSYHILTIIINLSFYLFQLFISWHEPAHQFSFHREENTTLNLINNYSMTPKLLWICSFCLDFKKWEGIRHVSHFYCYFLPLRTNQYEICWVYNSIFIVSPIYIYVSLTSLDSSFHEMFVQTKYSKRAVFWPKVVCIGLNSIS